VIDIVTIQPLVALVFGILILLLPRILNYLIAIYLIFIGLIGLFPHLMTHVPHSPCFTDTGSVLQHAHLVLQDGVDAEVIDLLLAIGTGHVEHVAGAIRAVDQRLVERRAA